jgi:hypothetical protein
MRRYAAITSSAGAAVLVAACAAVASAQTAATTSVNLLTNGGFERADSGSATAGAPTGWDPLWTRDAGTGAAATDDQVRHSGEHSLRVAHSGDTDWSEGQHDLIPVQPGDIFTLAAWVRCDHHATPTAPFVVSIGLIARRSDGATLRWDLGQTDAGSSDEWQHIVRHIVIPTDCATIQFRFLGMGPGTAWFDDASLIREGSVNDFRKGAAGRSCVLDSRLLHVRVDGATGCLTVLDRRIGRTWNQQAVDSDEVVVTGLKQTGPGAARLSLYDVPDNLPLRATVALSPTAPEVAITLDAAAPAAPITDTIAFPRPFVSGAGASLVVPLNEGILYPVDDAGVAPLGQLVAYGGHGICMPWWGVVDGASGAGVQAIIDTPDDARIDVERLSATADRLFVRPLWDATHGTFGYTRRIRYTFSPAGGYVAQAKRYRELAREQGNLRTLAEKRRANPYVDRLIGAVNVWNWDADAVSLCREMKSLGMDHVLWSNARSPSDIAAINALGYLTSRYDIYQDVYPPNPVGLNTEGWPDDRVRLPNGDWMKGWADIRTNADGTQTIYQGGVINSVRGLARAKREIPADLATHPYHCRFLDTTTASPFREDYDPAHPLTRSQDRAAKMALLRFCSQDMNLVVGSETGLDAAVPYVDYFEGMMSIAPYRLPDAGRDMAAYKPPTPDFLKYQVGATYRIPLWELVYHDCVVAHWYWGDSSNKVPEVWGRRDLFNILYGTPPMFLFAKATWDQNRPRFLQSYRSVCPIARRLGYDEMLSHAFLTADHAVQRTRWRSGAVITVNFGSMPFHDGAATVGPMGFAMSPSAARPPRTVMAPYTRLHRSPRTPAAPAD